MSILFSYAQKIDLLRECYYGKELELTNATSGYDKTWEGDAKTGDYV